MKSPSPGPFNSLYVLATGSLGVLIGLGLFMWNYPAANDTLGRAFVDTTAYPVWVFLQTVLCCLLTVLFFPVWIQFGQLFRAHLAAEKRERRRFVIGIVLLEALLLSLLVAAIIQIAARAQAVNFDLNLYVPRGHSGRMYFLYAYTFLTTLPLLLGMLVLQSNARRLSDKIHAARSDVDRLFALVPELLANRSRLQSFLAIAGLILSLVPINTAGLRAILVALNKANDIGFPVTNAILFGLVFTVLLLLIYIPAHFALAEAGRQLRDHLSPLKSLATLAEDLHQRKVLDDLLETNINLTQNLRTGLITISPLLVSLVTSLLNININLP